MGEGVKARTQVGFSLMKIQEMTRKELSDYMKSNGEIHRFDPDAKSWQRAFQLAKLSGLEHLEMDCTKCIQKVMEFIKGT